MTAPDDLRDLPGLAGFGDELVAVTRAADAAAVEPEHRPRRSRPWPRRRSRRPRRSRPWPRRRSRRPRRSRPWPRRRSRRPRRAPPWPRRRSRRPLRALAVTGALLTIVAATAAGATAVVLRSAVIPSPAPDSVPAEQTTVAGTGVVVEPRASDPAGGPPWALRIARSTTGYTCTTVGQVRDAQFGLVGTDGRFRLLPGDVTDACGDGGTLLGVRVVAADDARDVRSILYGVGGARLRSATLETTDGSRVLRLGARGTFVAALRGYPEDRAISVRLRFAGGRSERHDLGISPSIVPDPAAGQAWRIDRLTLGTRQFCARLLTARPSRSALAQSRPDAVVTPTACIDRRGPRSWVADARRFAAGQRGVPGFDRWTWRSHPPRTVLWGVANRSDGLREVTMLGDGAPRRLTISPRGTFAAVLPARVDPKRLRLVVRLADGSTQRGRPGVGLVADLVASRRVP